MSINNANNPHIISVALGAVAADTTFKVCNLGSKKAVIKRFGLVDVTGLAQSDTNYIQAQLLRNGVAIAEFSTKLTGGDGALVASTWAFAPEANVQVDGGSLDVKIDITASGALTAGAAAMIELFYE